MNKYKWFPVVFNTSFAVISLLIYTFTHMSDINSLVVLQIVIGAMIPFLLIVLTDLWKENVYIKINKEIIKGKTT